MRFAGNYFHLKETVSYVLNDMSKKPKAKINNKIVYGGQIRLKGFSGHGLSEVKKERLLSYFKEVT